MNLDMSQLESYQREQEANAEQLRRLRGRQEYLRLQIKQTRAYAKAARANPTIAAFIEAMPPNRVEVMPHPGGVSASIVLTPLDAAEFHRVIAKIPDIEHRSSEATSDAIGAPTLHKYRSPGGVTYYVTEHVK